MVQYTKDDRNRAIAHAQHLMNVVDTGVKVQWVEIETTARTERG